MILVQDTPCSPLRHKYSCCSALAPAMMRLLVTDLYGRSDTDGADS